MTNPVSSGTNGSNIALEKLKGINNTQNTQNKNDSIFGNNALGNSDSQDIYDFSNNKSTSYVEVKEGKNKKGEKTGLFRIRVYEDENDTEPKYEDQCFIFKTGKNENKYKFKTGQGNLVDFITKGTDISVKVSNGNRKLTGNVQKNDDGTFEYEGKSYNSLDEIAVKLNHIKLKENDAADGSMDVIRQGYHNHFCSGLSGANALSYTDGGEELLQECFVIDKENNTITVNFKGFNQSFGYNLNDRQGFYGGTTQFSLGDTEFHFYERAYLDLDDMILDGKFKLDKNAPSWCQTLDDIDNNRGNGTKNGIEPQMAFYALTGLKCNDRVYPERNQSAAKKLLSEFEKDKGTAIVVAKLYPAGTGGRSDSDYVQKKDAFGRSVQIPLGHSLAVKDVSTKTNGQRVITITDPKDTSKEIILDEDVFLETFNAMDSVRIKGNNKHPKYYQ